VTIRAIVGLAALNAGFAILGLAWLFAIRGLPRLADVGRLAGLGHLVGVALFGVAWTQLLVVGVPFGGIQVVLTLLLGTAGGLGAGLALRRPRPTRTPRALPPRTTLLVVAAGVALVGLLLEALFRAARLQSLQAFDAWAFWVPKAKAIYFFGGLDEQIFTTAAGPTYPPLVPLLDAAAFHAMGGADTITLHVQSWFLVVGVVAAIAGTLAGHAPAWVVWPSLLAVLVVPRLGEKLLTPQADVLVDAFFVVAALLLALWLGDGRGWRLATAAVLLAGATLTKREGLLFAAIALGAVLVAAWSRQRSTLTRLGGVALVVLAAAVPWRLWYRSRDLSGEAPADLGLGTGLDRALDAVRLSAEVLFETSLWSLVPFLLVGAIAIAVVWGDRRLGLFFGAVVVLVFLGGAWVTFSYAELELTADEGRNPIVRYTGAIVLLAAAAMPLLLAARRRRL